MSHYRHPATAGHDLNGASRWLAGDPPDCRFDMAIEADLIEEIARIHGYNNVPNSRLLMHSALGLATEARLPLDRAKDLLVDRGYQEAITYSFVDEAIQKPWRLMMTWCACKTPFLPNCR